MASIEERWQGVSSEVRPGWRPGQYAVTFRMGAASGRGGPARRVTIYLGTEHGGNLLVLAYDVAGPVDWGLERADFEQRSVEAVRAAIAAGMG